MMTNNDIGTGAFPLLGTLAPRTEPDPRDDQWTNGCEVLDRVMTRFAVHTHGARGRRNGLVRMY